MRNREKKEFCVMCENYYQREMDLEHGKYTIVPTGPTTPSAIDSRRQNTRTGAPSTRPSSQASSRSSHYRVTSPLSSPNSNRAARDLNGRISSSIVLPPAVASSNASFGMTSQQILNRQLSSDLDVCLHLNRDVSCGVFLQPMSDTQFLFFNADTTESCFRGRRDQEASSVD